MALLPRRASRPNNSCNSHCCSYLGGRKSHWTIRRSHQWCRWHCTLCKSGSPDRDPCGSVALSLIGDWDWDWVCASPITPPWHGSAAGAEADQPAGIPGSAGNRAERQGDFHWPVLDPESCNGLSMGRGGCDRRLCGDPYRCSEEQSKKHPSHQDEEGPAPSPGQGPPADHAAPGGRRQEEASGSLHAGDLISPWLPPWSVGPVTPGASPPERSASSPELAAAPQ